MMSNTKYNIAKRAREWADQANVLEAHYSHAADDHVVSRERVGKAVERLMREAYNEGFNAGYGSKKGKDECSCCAHTNETENSERK